mmetsp:Transcript_6718/g.11973  ORF Transcript_6718/g.11973 Transcript_6718/m.11973 type:complete len:126 (+) Transcript_6718:478-855(+)
MAGIDISNEPGTNPRIVGGKLFSDLEIALNCHQIICSFEPGSHEGLSVTRMNQILPDQSIKPFSFKSSMIIIPVTVNLSLSNEELIHFNSSTSSLAFTNCSNFNSASRGNTRKHVILTIVPSGFP